MKYMIKNMLRPLYYYLKSSKEREFQRIYNKYSHMPRYKRVNNIKFFNYIVDVPDIPSFIWQIKEIFVEEIYKFISNHEIPVIYDVGANIGLSCLYFKSLYPNAKIIAFEPDPEIVEILRSNLERNGFSDVLIINKAAWIHDGSIEFGCEGADGSSIFYEGEKRVLVQCVRLREFIEKEQYIDLLKMDIEGAEIEVLNDCKDVLDRVENVFVEYHSWNKREQKLSEILRILEELGFRYYIENIAKRYHPFVNKGLQLNMDLQLNIWASRR